jgi:hypothetical protein
LLSWGQPGPVVHRDFRRWDILGPGFVRTRHGTMFLGCIHVGRLRAQLGSCCLGEVTMVHSHRQPGANGRGDRMRVELGDSRRHFSILLVILVLLAAVGCSPPNEELANEPVLPAVESSGDGGGPGALMSGQLLVVGRCLYLVMSESGVRWLPVFVANSVSWERDTLVFRGQKFKVGGRVSVGGGEFGYPGNRAFLQEPHSSCEVQNVWFATHVMAPAQ